MIHWWENDLIDERINKICVEAKYKKYQLDLCDKYSPEFGIIKKSEAEQ